MSKASEWSAKASDKFSNIKDRITGSRSKGDGRNDGYDEYGYDKDGYGDYYGEDYDAYEDTYGQYDYSEASVGEVSTRGGGSSSTHPPLVSIDDVRANTQVPDRLRRDPLPGRDNVAGSSTSRYQGARQGPADATASYKPAPRAEAGHSRGYDSLFDSTGAAQTTPSTSRYTPAPTGASVTAAVGGTGYDPYATYEGTGSSTHTPTRNVKVFSPMSYGEVENVARSLKAGDAVVLSLRHTPSELSKRALDFSFGVASALDASVDCVADKVFVIARGASLTAVERSKLHAQGVI